jgi:hypothetical protein
MSEGTEACLDWMELKLVLAVLHPCTATEFLAAANKADDDGPIGALGGINADAKRYLTMES